MARRRVGQKWLGLGDVPSLRTLRAVDDLKLYRLAFFYFITFGGFVAMGFLLPTLLQDWFGYSKGEAAARAAGFIIAATLARHGSGPEVRNRALPRQS